MPNYDNMIILDELPKEKPYSSIHEIMYEDENLDFDQKYDKAIENLGGLAALKDYVPFTEEQIRTALKKGDNHLNTLPLHVWNTAAGFTQGKNGKMTLTYSPLWMLFARNGIRSASPSDCVCLLKRVATRMTTEQTEQTKRNQYA
ncbi:MAG: hypothetical protein HDQ88_08670 [Clostridia bacterium]|nr:hypothetical protein [Clostridia bacterium]